MHDPQEREKRRKIKADRLTDIFTSVPESRSIPLVAVHDSVCSSLIIFICSPCFINSFEELFKRVLVIVLVSRVESCPTDETERFSIINCRWNLQNETKEFPDTRADSADTDEKSSIIQTGVAS